MCHTSVVQMQAWWLAYNPCTYEVETGDPSCKLAKLAKSMSSGFNLETLPQYTVWRVVEEDNLISTFDLHRHATYIHPHMCIHCTHVTMCTCHIFTHMQN